MTGTVACLRKKQTAFQAREGPPGFGSDASKILGNVNKADSKQDDLDVEKRPRQDSVYPLVAQ